MAASTEEQLLHRQKVDPGRTKSELVAKSELDAGKIHPEEPGAQTEPDA